MRERGGRLPSIELHVGMGGIFRDEFDGGVARGVAGALWFDGSEKYGGVRGDAEKFAEWEAAVRKLA